MQLPEGAQPGEFPPQVAAGLTHVVVSWPLERTLVAWNIETGQQSAVTTLPCNEPLADLALGCGSRGPLLVTWHTTRLARVSAQLFDPADLTRLSDDLFASQPQPGTTKQAASTDSDLPAAWIDVPQQLKTVGDFRGPYTASRDGQLFLPKSLNEGLLIRDGQLVPLAVVPPAFRQMQTIAGTSALLPFASDAGITDGRSVLQRCTSPRNRTGILMIPTTSESLFSGVVTSDDLAPGVDAGTVVLAALGHTEPVAVFRDLNIRGDRPVTYHSDIGCDLPLSRRVYCCPTAGTLVAILPAERSSQSPRLPLGSPAQLLVKSFTLEELLANVTAGPPLVLSSPPCSLDAGEKLEYSLRAHAVGAPASFQLVVAPPDMQLDPSGTLRWTAPRWARDRQVPVSVAVGSDRGGAEYYHNFLLRVHGVPGGDAPPPDTGSVRELTWGARNAAETTKTTKTTPAVKATDQMLQATLRLPTAYEQVAWGRAGRYGCCWCPTLHSVLVADLQLGAWVRAVDVAQASPDEHILVASNSYLLLIDRDTRQYQRWSFASWQRDKVGQLDVIGSIQHAAIGCAADGGLLVASESRSSPGSFGSLGWLIDVHTMQTVWKSLSNDLPDHWTRTHEAEKIEASADGRAFLVDTGTTEPALVQASVTSDGLQGTVEVQRPHAVQMMGANRNLLLRPDAIVDRHGKLVGPRFSRFAGHSSMRVPARTGPFYLELVDDEATLDRRVPSRSAPPDGFRWRLAGTYFVGSSMPLHQFAFLAYEPTELPGRLQRNETHRAMLFADLQRMAYLPTTNRALLLFQLDPYQLLNEKLAHGIVVAESPPEEVPAGAEYSYKPTFYGQTEGLQLSLTQGPEGMYFEDDQTVVWSVPPDAVNTEVPVSIAYAIGDEKPHHLTYRLKIGRPELPHSELVQGRMQPSGNTTPPRVDVPTQPVPAIDWYDDLRNAPDPPARAQIVQLPSAIQRYCLGGSGRFLIAYLPQSGQLAVVDLIASRIHGFVPLSDDRVAFAAGQHKLYVVQGQRRQITRWDLTTLEMEQFRAIERGREIRDLAMGHCSDEPLYVLDRQDLDLVSIRCVDTETLESAPLPEGVEGVLGPRLPNFHAPRAVAYNRSRSLPGGTITASANGRLILHVGGVLRLSETELAQRSYSLSRALLGADGHTVFSRQGSLLFDWQLVPLRDSGKVHQLTWFAVSAHGRYAVRCVPQANPSLEDQNPDLELLSWDTEQVLCRLPNVLQEAEVGFPKSSRPLQAEQRMVYLPDARRLALLRPSGTEIYIRQFDWQKDGQARAKDYLFVESVPQYRWAAGSRFQYAPRVVAAHGPATVSLALGPRGLQLDDGTLRWSIPANHPARIEPIILTITDARGTSLRHAFDVQIYTARPAALANRSVDSGAGAKPIALSDEAMARGRAAATATAALQWQSQRLALLDNVGHTAIGGDGRYLAITMPAIRTIGVLDLHQLAQGQSAEDSVRRIRTETEIIALQAGPEDFYLQDKNRLMRFDFDTLTQQAERELPETWRKFAVPRALAAPICAFESKQSTRGTAGAR